MYRDTERNRLSYTVFTVTLNIRIRNSSEPSKTKAKTLRVVTHSFESDLMIYCFLVNFSLRDPGVPLSVSK